MMLRMALTAIAALAPAGAVQACALPGGGGEKVDSPRYELIYRAQPRKIPVSEYFSVELAVCAKGGAPAPESVQVDAQMPAHRHGMNYKASVKAQPGGYYRADGLLFHMPGQWQFAFELRAGGRTERMTHDVIVE